MTKGPAARITTKHRSEKFGEIYGNTNVVRDLKGYLEQGKTPLGFMLIGASGCGKTNLSLLIAKELGAEFEGQMLRVYSQLYKIDRKFLQEGVLREAVLPPMWNSTSRVFIFEEVEELSVAVQKALVGLLDYPYIPTTTCFILCTAEPERLIEPLKNRLVKLVLEPLSEPTMLKYLKFICTKEGVEVPEENLKRIVALSKGIPRNALTKLDFLLCKQPPTSSAA